MLQELFDLLLLEYSRYLVFLSIVDISQQEHFTILEALRRKDGAELENALSDHLRNVKTHILQGFKRMFVPEKESVTDWYSFR